MPLISVPVWQKGMPQSMQRAPWALQFFVGKGLVEFLPVLDALLRRAVVREFALVFHKSGWFTHNSPPRSGS